MVMHCYGGVTSHEPENFVHSQLWSSEPWQLLLRPKIVPRCCVTWERQRVNWAGLLASRRSGTQRAPGSAGSSGKLARPLLSFDWLLAVASQKYSACHIFCSIEVMQVANILKQLIISSREAQLVDHAGQRLPRSCNPMRSHACVQWECPSKTLIDMQNVLRTAISILWPVFDNKSNIHSGMPARASCAIRLSWADGELRIGPPGSGLRSSAGSDLEARCVSATLGSE